VAMDIYNAATKADEAAKARRDAERAANEVHLRLLQAQSLIPMVCMMSVHTCSCLIVSVQSTDNEAGPANMDGAADSKYVTSNFCFSLCLLMSGFRLESSQINGCIG
jgi:hypothetical protein